MPSNVVYLTLLGLVSTNPPQLWGGGEPVFNIPECAEYSGAGPHFEPSGCSYPGSERKGMALVFREEEVRFSVSGEPGHFSLAYLAGWPFINSNHADKQVGEFCSLPNQEHLRFSYHPLGDVVRFNVSFFESQHYTKAYKDMSTVATLKVVELAVCSEGNLTPLFVGVAPEQYKPVLEIQEGPHLLPQYSFTTLPATVTWSQFDLKPEDRTTVFYPDKFLAVSGIPVDWEIIIGSRPDHGHGSFPVMEGYFCPNPDGSPYAYAPDKFVSPLVVATFKSLETQWYLSDGDCTWVRVLKPTIEIDLEKAVVFPFPVSVKPSAGSQRTEISLMAGHHTASPLPGAGLVALTLHRIFTAKVSSTNPTAHLAAGDHSVFSVNSGKAGVEEGATPREGNKLEL